MRTPDLNVRVCVTRAEKEAAKRFRQEHFFVLRGIKDPYLWTLDHASHRHFALYKDARMIGYAHVQYWPDHRAALRIIVIDEKERKQGYGAYLLQFCEQRLKEEGFRIIQTEAAPDVIEFYSKLGYVEMPFNDPDHSPSDARDTAMGKRL